MEIVSNFELKYGERLPYNTPPRPGLQCHATGLNGENFCKIESTAGSLCPWKITREDNRLYRIVQVYL